MEGTVNKVRRQLVELQSTAAPEDRADVWVEGQTPEGYLQRFAWNEAKYPSRRPLKDIVASIMQTVQKLDDDLKVGACLPAGCWWLDPLGQDAERQVFPATANPFQFCLHSSPPAGPTCPLCR